MARETLHLVAAYMFLTHIENCCATPRGALGRSADPFVYIILVERMGGRGRVNPPSGTPFHPDSNELLRFDCFDAHGDMVDCDCT